MPLAWMRGRSGGLRLRGRLICGSWRSLFIVLLDLVLLGINGVEPRLQIGMLQRDAILMGIVPVVLRVQFIKGVLHQTLCQKFSNCSGGTFLDVAILIMP